MFPQFLSVNKITSKQTGVPNIMYLRPVAITFDAKNYNCHNLLPKKNYKQGSVCEMPGHSRLFSVGTHPKAILG